MVVHWMEKESLWKLRKEAGVKEVKEEDEIRGKEVTDLIDATMDPVMALVMALGMVMVVKQVVDALTVAERGTGLETVQMRVAVWKERRFIHEYIWF